MKNVKEIFDRSFKTWDIQLPQEDLNKCNSGAICSRGWRIQYIFGKNKTGEYLEYYASHRMTNDRHTRIYSSGRAISLITTGGGEFLIFPKNATAKDIELVRKKDAQRARRVSAVLKRKRLL